MVAGLTLGSFSRANSTREAGSASSTSSARGISSSVVVPSRNTAWRESNNSQA
jgi:hypothetical protein